jgi:hypothetical protein
LVLTEGFCVAIPIGPVVATPAIASVAKRYWRWRPPHRWVVAEAMLPREAAGG